MSAGSCLKRTAIGCGVVIALFMVLGLMIFVGAKMHTPKEAEVTELTPGQFEQILAAQEGGGLGLPDAPEAKKPVRLVLDLSLCKFEIKPGEELGKISVDGSYDRANFDLETKIEDKGDHLEYRVSFKNNFGFLGFLTGDEQVQANKNRLTLFLPKDLLFDIESKTRMGEYTYNLDGLAVRSMDVDMSMGEFEMRMEEANQVSMETMTVDTSMGEFTVYDLQNYGLRKGRLEGSMGEVRFRNSGLLKNDMELHVKMSMGEATIDLPINSDVDNSATAFMGEAYSNEKSTIDEGVQRYKVQITGGATMGQFGVRNRFSGEAHRVFFRKIREEGLEATLQNLRDVHATDPRGFGVRTFQLNRLGYRLLSDEMITEAIEVFKLNVELSPDYANGYDSLGEAYYKAGDIDLAIANYRKSLELDPENRNAVRQLRVLEGMGDQE